MVQSDIPYQRHSSAIESGPASARPAQETVMQREARSVERGWGSGGGVAGVG